MRGEAEVESLAVCVTLCPAPFPSAALYGRAATSFDLSSRRPLPFFGVETVAAVFNAVTFETLFAGAFEAVRTRGAGFAGVFGASTFAREAPFFAAADFGATLFAAPFAFAATSFGAATERDDDFEEVAFAATPDLPAVDLITTALDATVFVAINVDPIPLRTRASLSPLELAPS